MNRASSGVEIGMPGCWDPRQEGGDSETQGKEKTEGVYWTLAIFA